MKVNLFLVILIIVFLSIPSLDASVEISFLGGVNYVSKQGSLVDYEPGINDFPITPAHFSTCFGFSFSLPIIKYAGLELDFLYNRGSKILVEDPSDGEVIETFSADNINLIANINISYLIKRLEFYVVAGYGINLIQNLSDARFYSEIGNEISFHPPDRSQDTLLSAGGGIKLNFTRRLGLKFDARYIMIFSNPKIKTFNFIGGLIISI